jgi:hypothetical protein
MTDGLKWRAYMAFPDRQLPMRCCVKLNDKPSVLDLQGEIVYPVRALSHLHGGSATTFQGMTLDHAHRDPLSAGFDIHIH